MPSPFNQFQKVQKKAQELRNLIGNIASKRAEKKDIEELAQAAAMQSMKIGVATGQFRTREQAKEHHRKVYLEEIKILTKASESKNGEDVFNRAKAAAMQSMKVGIATGQFSSKEEAKDHYMNVYLGEIKIFINKNTNAGLRKYFGNTTRSRNPVAQALAAEAAAASLSRPPPSNAELEDLSREWLENGKGMEFNDYIQDHRKGGRRRKTRRTRRRR